MADREAEDGTYYLTAGFLGETLAVKLEETGGKQDVWRDLRAFDDREGTELSSYLDEESVLEVRQNLSGPRRYRVVRHRNDLYTFLVEATDGDCREVEVEVNLEDDSMVASWMHRWAEDNGYRHFSLLRVQSISFGSHERFVSAVRELDARRSVEGWEDGSGHAVSFRNAEVVESTEPDESPRSVSATKEISIGDGSLQVSITAEARALGLGRGDLVKITLERLRAYPGYGRSGIGHRRLSHVRFFVHPSHARSESVEYPSDGAPTKSGTKGWHRLGLPTSEAVLSINRGAPCF